MEPSALPAAATERLAALLADEAIDSSYLAFVARHVDVDDSTWRWCCGSHCDPCVQALGRVVDAARQVLCVSPNATPGLPKLEERA